MRLLVLVAALLLSSIAAATLYRPAGSRSLEPQTPDPCSITPYPTGCFSFDSQNHNGISEPGELKTLRQMGLKVVDLDYQMSSRTDQHGNQFRYRARIRDTNNAQLGRWAWDVFLLTAN